MPIQQRQTEVPVVQGEDFAPGKPITRVHPAEIAARSNVPRVSATGLMYARKTDGKWVEATEVETPREFAHRAGISVEFDSSHAHPQRVQRHGVPEWDGESDPRGKVLRVEKRGESKRIESKEPA